MKHYLLSISAACMLSMSISAMETTSKTPKNSWESFREDASEFCQSIDEKCLTPYAYPTPVIAAWGACLMRVVANKIDYSKRVPPVLQAIAKVGLGFPGQLLGGTMTIMGMVLGLNALCRSAVQLGKAGDPRNNASARDRAWAFGKSCAWAGLGMGAAFYTIAYGSSAFQNSNGSWQRLSWSDLNPNNIR